MALRPEVHPSPSLCIVVPMAAAVQAGPEEGEVKVHLGPGVGIPPGKVGDTRRHVVGIEDVVAMSLKAELVFKGD